MIGYIGTALLLVAYILLVTRWSKWFLAVDLVASGLLAGHAILIQDVPFIVVNGFVTIMLATKIVQKNQRGL